MPNPDAPADLVLTGGHVHTVDPARPQAEAVAIRGDRIVAVGSVADVRPLIGSRTRVVDLRGRLLVPGFQDAHVHPISAGIDLIECDVRDARGREAVVEAIRAYAVAHPDLAWVIGSGWSMADFERGVPRREDLDAAVPDRPAFLPNRDPWSWPASTARRPTRRAAGSSATWTAIQPARSMRQPRRSSSGSSRRRPMRRATRASGQRSGSSIRSGSRPGRTRSWRLPATRPIGARPRPAG
jgi:hypothetical protein